MSKDNLIPELRFPEFEKDGEWEEIRLKQAARFYRGLTYGKGDTSDSGLLVLRSGNIQHDTLVLDKDLVFVDKECSDELKLLHGDVVICMSNGSRALVGKNAVYQGEYDGKITVGAFCSIMRPKNKFTTYILKTDAYQSFISLSIGGGNINNLKNSDLEEYECAVPSNLDEQQKIASCLSSLDELIAAHTDKLDALKDHKKGLLQNLFPQEGETVPKVRFSEFEGDGEWIETTLEQVGDYENGKAHEKDIAENGDYIVVNSKFISTEGETVKYSDTAFCPANLGDILMVLSDVPNGKAIAKCFYVDEENRYSVNQRICRITATDCNSRFLFYIMDRNAYFLSFDDGVKQTNLRKSDVLEFPFRIPTDPVEQTKIASCISAIDELIKAQTVRIEELNHHKRGLMQGLFPKIES